MKEKATIPLPPELLKDYPGQYAFESMPDLPFTILEEDDWLFLSVPEVLPEPTRLYPEAENKFFIPDHGREHIQSC
jgi:hypothetical protein